MHVHHCVPEQGGDQHHPARDTCSSQDEDSSRILVLITRGVRALMMFDIVCCRRNFLQYAENVTEYLQQTMVKFLEAARRRNVNVYCTMIDSSCGS